MSIRRLDALRMFAAVVAIAVVTLVPVPAAGQGEATWSPPRTADGQPDLQGVWANNNVTPLERPEVLQGRETLTDEEVAALQARAGELFSNESDDAAFGDSVFAAALAEAETFTSRDTATGNYNQFWLVERDWDNRTSLIVDPPSGRLPTRTETATARMAERAEARRRHARGPEDRSLGERCISWGAPRLGAGYNSYVQLFQTPDHVVVYMEMGGSRVIPLTGSPHVDDKIRQLHGDPRGHWDGDTLVIETTNYSPTTYFMGSRDGLQVMERFNPRQRRRAAVRGDGDRPHDVGGAVDGHDSATELFRPRVRVRLPRGQHRHGGYHGRRAGVGKGRSRGGWRPGVISGDENRPRACPPLPRLRRGFRHRSLPKAGGAWLLCGSG